MVQDMVIIQGIVKNVVTQVEFVAPAYIPSTAHDLQFLVSFKFKFRDQGVLCKLRILYFKN